MDKIDIGKLIKDRRKELKVSQDDLCLGIYSASSLSRIENGYAGTRESSYIPSLFERLGMPTDSINEIISEDDYSVRQLIRKANQADVLGNRVEAWRIVRETRARINEDSHNISLMNEQRLIVLETELSRKDNKISVEEELKRLENALRMTAVNYRPDNLPSYMTNMECQILADIAIAYFELKQVETAIAIDSHVKRFMEFYIEDKIIVANHLTILCYNLSKMYGLTGKYNDSVAVARDGIFWHRYTGLKHTLPQTMYNCAWSLARRGEIGDMSEAKKLAYDSLELTKVMSKHMQVSPTLERHIQKLIDEYHL
ncbi:MAG: helix-turn-helix domain-containing protein [Oscillospiraceae bacterium]|nr:helix-turn-helix domain-containing protein [Oscillospiraceae bacterium]